MSEEQTNHFAQYIKRFRKTHELSLCKLADDAGVSKSMISQIEAGKTIPTLVVARKLAQAMGLPLGQLIDPFGEHENFWCHLSKNRTTLLSPDGAIQYRPVNTRSNNRSIEMLEFKILKKGTIDLERFPTGTREYWYVQSGEVMFRGIEDTTKLGPTDAVETCALITRSLIQKSSSLAKGILVRHYGC